MKFYKKINCEPAIYRKNFLNKNACESFIDFYESNLGKVTNSKLAENLSVDPDKNIRSSKSLFFDSSVIHPKTYKAIYDFVDESNNLNWRFNVDYLQSPQIIKYDQIDDHYSWHTDWGTDINTSTRKLTMVIQLSDPSDYEGCDLQLHFAPEIATAPKERGTAILFPSFLLHRATPLISGERYILVLWFCGDSFT